MVVYPKSTVGHTSQAVRCSFSFFSSQNVCVKYLKHSIKIIIRVIPEQKAFFSVKEARRRWYYSTLTEAEEENF